MDRMEKKFNWQMYLGIIVLAFFFAFWPGRVFAGSVIGDESGKESRTVEVALHGMTRFGGVQLVDYLLHRLPGVVEVRQVSFRLVPDEPEICRAGWAVRTKGDGADQLLLELMTTVRSLDPARQNEILYDAPFVVMQEDLEMVKQINPVATGTDFLSFAVAGRVEQVGGMAWQRADAREGRAAGNYPWYRQPGMGFE
jgi:hypothetical protein